MYDLRTRQHLRYRFIFDNSTYQYHYIVEFVRVCDAYSFTEYN
jgi:hypothetical protein